MFGGAQISNKPTISKRDINTEKVNENNVYQDHMLHHQNQ
jgi:hypothetical protein